jgi:Icc-related predicted phosphoesterase
VKLEQLVEPRSLRLVLLSDTHLLEREIDVTPGDILIHAGDFTTFGNTIPALENFNRWLGTLPHRHKIVVPAGNHELVLEADPTRRKLLSHATVLLDEAVTIEGLRIWGSPVTPLYGGAFGLWSAQQRRALYNSIPKDTDVLVTHGPPLGIFDRGNESQSHDGCKELLEAVMRVKPRLHVFGHIHSGAGIFHTQDTTFVNCAILAPDGDSLFEPTVMLMRAKNRRRPG